MKQDLDELLNHATHQQASDIHLEPLNDHFRIRYRIDSVLHQTNTYTKSLGQAIISQLKVRAKLDIAEKRLPQDGRFQLTDYNNQLLDCRFSSCPTAYGEKVVLRLLRLSTNPLQLNQLGLNPAQQLNLNHAIHQPQGLIIITGPTGSGKTTTLYTALNAINAIEKNIVTAEDPVEISLHGINQTNIQPDIGLTYHRTLKALLRQDPDIIMLGEIRDAQSAAAALDAANTGHLVLTTLHTNSALDTLHRLERFNIQPAQLAESLQLIIAQRLVRKLCATCYGVQEDCDQCYLGYRGRTGLFECLINTADVKSHLLNHSINPHTMKNFISPCLREAGQHAVTHHITSQAEITRVLGRQADALL